MSKSIIRRITAGAVAVAAVGTVALGAAGPSAHAGCRDGPVVAAHPAVGGEPEVPLTILGDAPHRPAAESVLRREIDE